MTVIGVTSASMGALGVPAQIDMARAAAEMGYGQFWTAEAVGTESFALLGATGASVAGLSLGTGVLALQLRTPPLTAMAAATLQALFPDREIILGVGISSKAVAGQWHGATFTDRPVAQTREYLTVLRACLSGETVNHAGDFYNLSKFRLGVRLGERRPKIVLAALNRQMLQLGGELADGVLLNYIPSSHVAESVAAVRAGGPATIYSYIHACVADLEASLPAAKRDLYGYATADGYRRMFTAAGFGAEMTEMMARLGAGDRDGAVEAISVEMVQAINTIGDRAHVAAFSQRYLDEGVEVPVLMPMPWGPDRRQCVIDTMSAFASVA
jgi:probable F420-dependent oxidoreductase